MSTAKIQNAFKAPADTDDIADLLMFTATVTAQAGGAQTGDAGGVMVVFHNGTADVLVSSTNPLPISAASLPLPTGAATAANQSTGNTSLAAIDGKLAAAKTADFDTGAGTDTVQLLGIALPAAGGAVAGGTATNPLKVDGSGVTQPVSLASVPSHAVTNAGTFVVQADSVIPGTGATNLGKAEDAVHASGDVGVMLLGVRQDVAAALSANGDYTPLQFDASGSARVNVTSITLPPTIDVSGSAVLATTEGGWLHDQAATPSAVRPNVTGGLASAAARADVSADNDAVLAWYLRNGALVCNLAVGGTLVTGSAGLPVAQQGTWTVAATNADLAAIAAAIKAEDAASANGDAGLVIRVVRADTPANTSGLDGDYESLYVSGGLLWTRVRGLQTPNGDSAMDDVNDAVRVNLVAGGGSGGTSATDDAAFTPASGAYTPAGGIVTSDSVDAGDGGAFAMLANRQQKVTLFDSSGVELAVGGGTQYMEDAAAAANPTGNALIMVRDDVLSGQTTADGNNVAARGTDKGELYVKHVDAIPVTDNAGSLTVDGSVSLAAAIPAGTNNIGDVDVLSLPNVTLAAGTNTNEVVGDAAHDAVAAGNPLLVGAYASAAAPADVSADGDAVRLWALRNGSPVVNLAAGGTLITATSTSLNANITNASLTVASHPVTNVGTFAVQVDGSALTSLQLLDDVVFTDDAAFTPGTSKVAALGWQADETSTDSVDEGDIGCPRMTLDRKVIVTPQPHTAGGLSIFRSLDLDETEEDVKTSAGQLYGGWVTNFATSTRYIKLYNATAANVIVGTTAPVITLAIPGNATDDIAALLNLAGGLGIEFTTAICAAATTGLADNNTGAPAANDVLLNLFYK